MACEHPNLTVRQDPNDGRKEIRTCPDCKIEKSRVSAAASIKDAAEARIGASEKLWAEGFDGLGERVAKIEADTAALIDRLAKLESFSGVA